MVKIQKFGSLRFWGDWFGRPMDNCHKPVSASFDRYKNFEVRGRHYKDLVMAL